MSIFLILALIEQETSDGLSDARKHVSHHIFARKCLLVIFCACWNLEANESHHEEEKK